MDKQKIQVLLMAITTTAVLATYIKRRIENRRNRSCWNKPWLNKTMGNLRITKEFKECNDLKAFKNYLRMDELTFDKLLVKIEHRIKKSDTFFRNSISPKEKLIITLRYLATGESFMSLQYNFRISNSAISLFIPIVCKAIYNELKKDYLKMEKVARVLFLWRCEVEEQRDCAEDMRRRNEALVYNILPPHVATHFMGNRKRQHDELYSQSYAEVGVLFASMPNFSDFYSEETVNNQGLECLRFLNEVISDFDALLELPKFQDVIKIKTIGSTYMAASGLNPTRQMKPEDPILIRWAHLAILVDFALELKKALQSINEQSFNHFVLKLGVNHGPITAGVIGARKPHYDIWGNTVNVASRMESTGKAGCIQVTEETCEILQHFGYQFEQRGLVSVKGKGQLMTYYLQGKAVKINPPTMASGSPMIGVATMETVNEEDESHDSPTSKSEEKTIIECSENTDDGNILSENEVTCEETLIKKEVEPKDSTEATLLLSRVDT